nr:MAG TPA: hypothetical protein [Caudoviricetes sp.]
MRHKKLTCRLNLGKPFFISGINQVLSHPITSLTSKISQFVILVYLNLRLSSTIYLKNIAICDIV